MVIDKYIYTTLQQPRVVARFTKWRTDSLKLHPSDLFKLSCTTENGLAIRTKLHGSFVAAKASLYVMMGIKRDLLFIKQILLSLQQFQSVGAIILQEVA